MTPIIALLSLLAGGVADSQAIEPALQEINAELYSVEILNKDNMPQWLPKLAQMAVLYEEWPYFCRANSAKDTKHVEKIINNPHGVVCVAYDNKHNIIGVAMGRPQADVPCIHHQFPNVLHDEHVFHLQDCLVKPQYRKHNIAQSLYEHLEQHIISSPYFDRISYAAVVRPKDFRLPPPSDYVASLEDQLEWNGFKQIRSETPFYMEWTLIDENADTRHSMILWMKNLPK